MLVVVDRESHAGTGVFALPTNLLPMNIWPIFCPTSEQEAKQTRSRRREERGGQGRGRDAAQQPLSSASPARREPAD